MSTSTSNKPTYAARVMGSLRGIVGGIILVLIAAFLLWRNEGRTDYSRIADDSMAISADVIRSSNDGELVAARGVLTTDEALGDSGYLKAGDYLELTRNVEMFAWVERSDTEGETTTYSYVREWTERPTDSSSFENSAEHTNPPLTITEQEYAASSGQLGAFRVDLRNLRLPSSRDLQLSQNMLASNKLKLDGNYIFIGDGTAAAPQVGDVRVSYEVIPSGLDVTVFGSQQGERLVPYLQNNSTSLYRAYEGSREAGIAAMRSAYTTSGWMTRGIGFGLMWLGLTLLFAPISAVLSFVPALANLSRTMLRILTFGIAFAVSLLVIVVSAIAHSIVALIILALLIVGAVILTQREKIPQFAQ